MHLEEPFLHNKIDAFLDVLFGVSIVLLVANAFGFRHVSWARSVGPCLAALGVLMVMPYTVVTPGFRMAKWAEQSPWDGYQPPVVFFCVDPWLILAADLLVFTTGISVLVVISSVVRSQGLRLSRIGGGIRRFC